MLDDYTSDEMGLLSFEWDADLLGATVRTVCCRNDLIQGNTG
jgi:hypothetical protein